MWNYKLTSGMWARKFRRDASYTLRELEREITNKGLKLNTPRMDGRVRGSRRLVAVEPARNRIVAQFDKDMSRWEIKPTEHAKKDLKRL